MEQPPLTGIILNDIDLSVAMPRETAGWILRRPGLAEVESFRDVITNFYGAQRFLGTHPIRPPHEATYVREGDGILMEWNLPGDKWRYSIVEPTSAPELPRAALEQALRISDADLWAPLWVELGRPFYVRTPNSLGRVWSPVGNPNQAFQFFDSRHDDLSGPESLNLAEVAEVVELRAALDDAAYPAIAAALQGFLVLDGLPERSTQKFLGYFGVLESLLSHKPEPSDPVDSITRQLIRGLLLLNNRLPDHRKLGLDSFGATLPKKVIRQLYAYRSAAAHSGSTAKELNWFEGVLPKTWTGNISLELHLFVRRLTKRVLIAAMHEPQLVMDLACEG
ncbi:hypothetical protein [Nocardia salmonicida]|uniref:hypothetical protein n=1 Tax=Nocardia salmonicida TaxID=53431 RepID=UPI0033E7FD93